MGDINIWCVQFTIVETLGKDFQWGQANVNDHDQFNGVAYHHITKAAYPTHYPSSSSVSLSGGGGLESCTVNDPELGPFSCCRRLGEAGVVLDSSKPCGFLGRDNSQMIKSCRNIKLYTRIL